MRLLLPACLLPACTGTSTLGPGVQYTLQLQPVLPTNHDPFAELLSLELLVEPAVGDSTRVGLDVPDSGGTSVAESLPEFEEAMFSVYGYDKQGLRAYGHAGPFTVLDGDDLVIPLLFAEVDKPGWLGALAEPLYAGEMLAVGGGVFRLFGGVSETSRGSLTVKVDTIQELRLAEPSASPAFTEIGVLPTWTDKAGGTHTARAGFRMHPLSAGPHAGEWLLAGGSEEGLCRDARTVAGDAWYYNGESGTFTALEAAMDTPREHYTSLVDARGNVIYQGGSVYDNEGGCFIFSGIERFVAESERFELLDGGGELGVTGGVAASLGNSGSIFCGGADINRNGWTSTSGCVLVSLEGATEVATSLPESLAGAAATRLEGGEMLVTGGVTVDEKISGGDGSTPARDEAWLYTDGGWRSIGRMALPRAGHRMELLPDGRVLVLGGAATWGPFLQSVQPYACAELYDPEGETFTPLSACDGEAPAGDLEDRAEDPMVAFDPDFGVVLAGGANGDDSASSRVAVFVPSPE